MRFLCPYALLSGYSEYYRTTNPATPLDAKGAAAGFVVATPQAERGGPDAGLTADVMPPQRWSNGSDPEDTLFEAEAAEEAAAAATGAAPIPDDIAFAWAVAACIRDTLRVRLSGAVFAAGWSQGAKLASALACDAPAGADADPTRGFSLAALAVGGGLRRGGCAAAGRTPLLLLHGGQDTLVPFCSDGGPYKSVRSALDTWVAPRASTAPCAAGSGAPAWRALCADESDAAAVRVYLPASTCAAADGTEAPGADAAPVVVYWLPQQPHMLPDGRLPGLSGDMSALFVAWFASVRDGAPDVAPLRDAGGQRLGRCSSQEVGRGPCASAPPPAWLSR
jgi:hypothetical protein